MTEHTPEKVADLIAEARRWASGSPLGKITAREVDRGILFARRLADALEAVTAEREADRVECGRRWANVIKANVALIDRLSGVEAERDEAIAGIASIRAARSNHPECDVHDDADPVTCGWKRAVQDIDTALSRIPEHPKEGE